MKDVAQEDILKLLQEGDHSAFETVFIAHFRNVKHFIGGLVKSSDVAEELAQDIFMKLWETRQSLDPSKKIGPYLYVMARNASFNYIKSKVVRDTYINNYLFQDQSETPDDIIMEQELKLLGRMVVENMPAQRKAIYKMSRTEGLKNDEIAERLNISKKTVENQLSLALKDLKKIIYLALIFLH